MNEQRELAAGYRRIVLEESDGHCGTKHFPVVIGHGECWQESDAPPECFAPSPEYWSRFITCDYLRASPECDFTYWRCNGPETTMRVDRKGVESSTTWVWSLLAEKLKTREFREITADEAAGLLDPPDGFMPLIENSKPAFRMVLFGEWFRDQASPRQAVYCEHPDVLDGPRWILVPVPHAAPKAAPWTPLPGQRATFEGRDVLVLSVTDAGIVRAEERFEGTRSFTAMTGTFTPPSEKKP